MGIALITNNILTDSGAELTGYVPYTGATADVNLGTFDLTAERGTFANNGSSDTLTVNHTSGSGKGINVSKGGNGEALLVTKTSGSGNAVTITGGLFSAEAAVFSGGITTNLTQGSVPFIGASGLLSQDNTNLFWDNTNKRLGVGTNAPNAKFEVVHSSIVGAVNVINTTSLGASSGGGVAVRTNAHATAANQRLGGFFFGSSVGAVEYSPVGIFAFSSEAHNDSSRGGYLTFEVNNNGTNTRTQAARIFPSGNFTLQNGGTFTDAGFRLDVNGQGRFKPLTNGAIILGSPDSTNGIVISANSATAERFDIRRYANRVSFLAHSASTAPGEPSGIILFNTGNVSLNTATDAGFRLDVNGTARVQGVLTATADAVVNGVNVGIGGGAIASNTRVGVNALNANTTGIQNTAFGRDALLNNTTPNNNSAFGNNTLRSNTTGFQNTAIGASALQVNNGNNNTATGVQTLQSNTTGFSNTANGFNALNLNTTGFNNTAVGATALQSNTTGSNNIANGVNAGRYIADGTTVNSITNNSVFIGADTRAAADNQTNQIVIGHTAIGLGSNTTVLGNSSTTFGRWFGNLLIGTSTNNGTNLRVVGTTQSDIITQNLASHGVKVLQYTSVSSTTINLPTEFPLMTGLVVANSYAVFGKFLGKYINYGQAIEFYISKNPNGMWNTVAYSNSSQFMAALISVTGSGNDLTITTNTGTSFILELTVMTQS